MASNEGMRGLIYLSPAEVLPLDNCFARRLIAERNARRAQVNETCRTDPSVYQPYLLREGQHSCMYEWRGLVRSLSGVSRSTSNICRYS